jgi:hypothetical protein
VTTAYLLGNQPLNFDKVPKELAEIYPIEETLRILGFNEKSQFGLPKRSWGPLEVVEGHLVGCWQLMFSTLRHTEHEIPIP